MLVSIIIPIYNTECYIEQCLHSLFQQTYDNIEYIFVDDASTDESINIFDRIVQEYPNIREKIKFFQNKKNEGVANTRNIALSKVTGKYFIAVDSDDWIEKNMIEELLMKAISTDTEIVVCDYYREIGLKTKYCKQHCFENTESFVHNLICGGLHGSLCNKLIKSSLLQQYPAYCIPNINFCEDTFLVINLAMHTREISYFPQAYYHYRYNLSSITTNMSLQQYYKQFELITNLFEKLPEQYYSSIKKYEVSIVAEIALKEKNINNLKKLVQPLSFTLIKQANISILKKILLVRILKQKYFQFIIYRIILVFIQKIRFKARKILTFIKFKMKNKKQ